MRSIGLVAHDVKKQDMLSWAKRHRDRLVGHRLFATGTTGGVIKEGTGLEVALLRSGPRGGDQQLGAMIAEGRLDVLFFFIDPMSSMPHDVDIRALIRLGTLYDIPFACNPATADRIISAPDW